MVIGNGMIAKAFSKYQFNSNFIIFASGVSQSRGAPEASYTREKQLLHETIKKSAGKILVYFSTCSIYDNSMKDTAYVKHKLNLEEYITRHKDSYTIFRLSNPVGKTNNTDTIINYFIKSILEQRQFDAWENAARNIIDINDMYLVCNEILENNLFPNSIINIANVENYPVPYIIRAIEKNFNIKGKYKLVTKGDEPRIDVSQIKPLFAKFDISFDKDYLSKILQKYFPSI